MTDRSESDRLQQENWFQRTVRRPEIGAFIVMMIIIAALAMASGGKAFNALGLKKQRSNHCTAWNNSNWSSTTNDCWRI